MSVRRDFWVTSGYHLTELDAEGRLSITPDLLRAYLSRPELAPVDESCESERAAHAALIADPRSTPDMAVLDRFQDQDTRANYEVFLKFRDFLVQSKTLEAAYRGLVMGPGFPVPDLFVDQIVHALTRHVLEACDDPIQLRAAELFFRAQRISIQDGQIMAADEETVERFATTGGFGDLGRLLVESNTATRAVDLDVLEKNTKDQYWERSDRFDMVLDLSFARPGLDGFCRAMEKWVSYFMGITVRLSPVQSIRDERWVWHTGLDPDASALLNDLYRGEDPGEARLGRLLCLFRMEIKEQDVVLDRVKGKPVYLGLCMDTKGLVKMKPQNLLVNLPLKSAD